MDSRTRRAWVEVDLRAIRANAATLSRHCGRPLLPMVKADGYGLGAVAVAKALQGPHTWGFGVATVVEAEQLRDADIPGRIVIFTPTLPWDFASIREAGATPTLGDPAAIAAWIESGGGPWHLAIDSGMHRAGIEWHRVAQVVDLLRQCPPEGAFTHFHTADADAGSVSEQLARFRAAVGALPARPALLHAENSPGIERLGPSEWDLVRPGVFLYGVGGAIDSSVQPAPVAHLRARVVEVHAVAPGEGVSYGATWRASRPTHVATLAVGYADGYRRLFSSHGQVILNGTRAPVVGRVTMDMTMIDVTDVSCGPGDVATLLGRAGDDHLDINVIGDAVGLLSYELLVGLRLRVPRIYLPA